MDTIDLNKVKDFINQANKSDLSELKQLIDEKIPEFTNKVDIVNDWDYVYLNQQYYMIDSIESFKDDSDLLILDIVLDLSIHDYDQSNVVLDLLAKHLIIGNSKYIVKQYVEIFNDHFLLILTKEL